jgi:hypothetical protein
MLRFASLLLLGALLFPAASLAAGQTAMVPIEQVIKNAEAATKKKSTTGTWATLGRLYATAFEGEHEVEVWASEKAPANAKGTDPSLRIAPLKGGVDVRRTRAIEAYRRSVEIDASNAASWLALGWLYRSGDKPDEKLALQSYKKVERLLQTPQDERETATLTRALDALEVLQEGDPAALAAIAKRRRNLASP